MQTFFNPTTPFLDSEGKPMVEARVSFLDLETDAHFIEITDNTGTPLENPLFTGSDGRLMLHNGTPVVPCIADGVSYKVTVARRTGVEPVIVGGVLMNPGELYEEPYIAFVVTAMGGGSGSGGDVGVVDGIADVRLSDPSLGSVLCCGYYSAGDCPARVFTWTESENPPEDNGITVLRNPNRSGGYWRMGAPEGGLWDVRIAGLKTSNEAAMNSLRLTTLLNLVNGQGTPVPTVYFPAGDWVLDGGFTCASLILEKGANIKPSDNVSDRTVRVLSWFENRGGKFWAYDTSSADSKRMLLRTPGVVHSSWFEGTINEFLIGNYLSDSDIIMFDNEVTAGTHAKTFTGKLVIARNAIPSNLTFSESIILDLLNRRVITKDAKVGDLVAVDSEYQEDGNYYSSVKFYFGQTLVAEVDGRRGFVLGNVSIEDLAVETAEIGLAKVKNFRVETSSNTYYVETDDDVDITSVQAKEGDVLFLVNTKDGQISVTCKRMTDYHPMPYHNHFTLNSGNGIAMLCTQSYVPASPPDIMYTTLAAWVPLSGHIVITRTEDE